MIQVFDEFVCCLIEDTVPLLVMVACVKLLLTREGKRM